VPIARCPTRIWLVLGVFLAATVLGMALAARRLAAGRAQAWAAPRPPRRARLAMVDRGNAKAGSLAACTIEPGARWRPWQSTVVALSESLMRRLAGAARRAVVPVGSVRLRC
jgi:hypothetical protein